MDLSRHIYGQTSENMQTFRKKRGVIVRVLFLAILLNLSLAGCVRLVDYENTQVIDFDAIGYINAETNLGQTFIIRRQPLSGIQLWLRLADETQELDANLTFRLYSGENLDEQLYAGQISYQSIKSSYPLRIEIPPIQLPKNETYLLVLEADGSPVWVYGRTEDAYPYGYAIQNDKPINSDIAFRLTYSYGFSDVLVDFQSMWNYGKVYVPLLAILLLPGILLTTFQKKIFLDNDLAEKLGVIIAVSISFPAVLVTWTSLVGITWAPTFLRILYLLFGVIIVINLGITRRHHWHNVSLQYLTSHWKPTLKQIAWYAGWFLIFTAAWYIRLAMVRDLSAPAWVDSVHHTLITDLILNQGAIPTNFLPYADVATENYHTGFHVLAAWFAALSELESVDAVFLLGQFINAASIFPAYLLAKTLTNQRIAGVISAVVAGFITPMPAYYTSWGRYTQLVGLFLLPAAFMMLRQYYLPKLLPETVSTEDKTTRFLNLLMVVLVVSSIIFIHYRVAAFLICLVIADFFTQLPLQRAQMIAAFRYSVPRVIGGLIIILLVASPILLPLIIDLLPQRAVEWNNPNQIGEISLSWSYLTSGLGNVSLIFAAIGLLVALVFDRRLAICLITWVLLMLLIANAHLLGTPTQGLVSNDSVFITLFMPLSVATGYVVGKVTTLIHLRSPIFIQAFVWLGITIFIAVAIFYGAKAILPIINPATVIFHAEDRTASVWITKNLPDEAKFLINLTPWGYGNYSGSDGGYWISALTGRLTFPPTLLYGHGNRLEIAEINQKSKDLIGYIQTNNIIALKDFMTNEQIEYIYIGVKGGILSPQTLLVSGFFELIYHENGVWMFRLLANN
jgi:hypothetical protein